MEPIAGLPRGRKGRPEHHLGVDAGKPRVKKVWAGLKVDRKHSDTAYSVCLEWVKSTGMSSFPVKSQNKQTQNYWED